VGERRRGREFALQVLFQVDLGGEPVEAVLATFWTGKKCAEEARLFAEDLARGTLAQISEIDAMLREGLEHWRLPRIAAVDRSILRLAVHEMLHHPETPPIVVIDEAIELAKRFGGDESGTFINGVLDGVRKRLAGEGERSRSES
jgi:transcription antitermination protein NusB